MTRGFRHGNLTKDELVQRLRTVLLDEISINRDMSVPCLLGLAIHYGLVTELEITETIPRVETTISCYMKSIIPSTTLPEIEHAIDQYVMTTSRMYNRGTYIANFVAMYLYGERLSLSLSQDLLPISINGFGMLGRELVRYDREASLHEAEDLLEFVMPRDVRNSAFKQVFLPERWPTRTQPLNLTISDVIKNETSLPPEPIGWRALMNPTGWDNSINRIATKLSANFQVHCRVGLAKRTSAWLGQLDFEERYTSDVISLMQQTLLLRPRPIIIDNRDYEMIMDLRIVLGVTEDDVTWYVPRSHPFNREVVALHAFITRYGDGERSYFPVARRSRKFAYLDVKIYDALTSVMRKKRGRTYDETDQFTHSRSLGDAMGLTSSSFKETRKRIRKHIRREIARRKRKRPNNPSIKRIQKKRKRLGRGFIHPDAVVQSMETDGVGARLCVKTPIDMIPFVKQFERPVTEERQEGQERMKNKRKRTHRSMGGKGKDKTPSKDEVDEEEMQQIYAERLRKEAPITIGVDNGRKKLFVGAISKGYKKPTTATFTRSRYYSDMRYWRHQAWSNAQTSREEISRALADVSVGGGMRCCELATWRASLEAERVTEQREK